MMSDIICNMKNADGSTREYFYHDEYMAFLEKEMMDKSPFIKELAGEMLTMAM